MSKTLFPGDIGKHEVKIDGTDVTNFVFVTQIFHEIQSPFWTAQLGFMDTQNLPMTIPIKIGSEVKITVETNAPKPGSGQAKYEFLVYKISDRTIEKQETMGYVVHCVSKELFENAKKRISKSYKEKTPPDLVREFVKEMKGSLDKQDSDSNKYSVIIPNWSPVAAIEWVCKFSQNSSSGADFFFFQSDKAKFNFRSIEKMLKDKAGEKLKQVHPNARSSLGSENQDGFINIEEWHVLESHDAVRMSSAGYYGSKRIKHNIIDKTLEDDEFAYGDDCGEDMSKAPFDTGVFTGFEDSVIAYAPEHPKMYESGDSIMDNLKDWWGSRLSSIQKLESNRSIAMIPGYAKAWEWLGKSIEVQLPSHQDHKSERFDEYLKGDYLVVAVKTIVTNGRCRTALELAKKRLEKPY